MITSSWRAHVAQLLVGAGICSTAYLLAGCIGELVELTDSDLSATIADMTTSGGDGGGGGGPHFIPDIQNDLNAKSCGLTGCHGPGSPNMPVFINKPMTTADEDANYNNFKTQALNLMGSQDPAMSYILTFLLPGGGHGGGTMLPSTSDPVYLRWKAWIAAGGPR